MLFKKSILPAPPPIRNEAWEKPDQTTQTLWVSVADWQYKVFPSREAQSFGHWLFQFEGNCRTHPLRGAVCAGSIEVLERGETPGMLRDHWEVVPKNVEGYAYYMPAHHPEFLPSFGITLFCQESALDWVYRAFSTASSNRLGSIGIELTLDCPNGQGEGFWRDQWKNEWLRVVSWGLYTGTQLRDPAS